MIVVVLRIYIFMENVYTGVNRRFYINLAR